MSQRPGDHECFDYHRDYVGKVPEGDILQTLATQHAAATKFINSIPADQLEQIHAPYSWKVRTVIEHCCDAERVFGYRILRFAAGDPVDLPGWDQNLYADSEYGNAETPADLAEEFDALRRSNLLLIKRLSPESINLIGTADGRKVSVRTLIWLMAGHWEHHLEILQQRLGS